MDFYRKLVIFVCPVSGKEWPSPASGHTEDLVVFLCVHCVKWSIINSVEMSLITSLQMKGLIGRLFSLLEVF